MKFFEEYMKNMKILEKFSGVFLWDFGEYSKNMKIFWEYWNFREYLKIFDDYDDC
jgi:hypothetical protein